MLQDYRIEYPNARTAFLGELSRLMRYGSDSDSRNGKVREAVNALVYIEKPQERYYLLRHRNDSVFEKIAETLWVLAGRNDVSWLTAYLPQAAAWSDDGLTWRAGYGKRLRSYGAGTDQVAACVKILTEDRTSRRAVMSLFDPDQDYQETKDVPCNNWISWLIRNDTLYMNVAQRSSDLMWGFSGINTFEWSVLHQMMAYWTNSKVGRLTYFMTSLHIYEKHWAKAQKILEGNYIVSVPTYLTCHSDTFSTDLDKLPITLQRVFDLEAQYRAGKFDADLNSNDELLFNFTLALKIYWMLNAGADKDDIAKEVNALGISDLSAAVLEYILRHDKVKILEHTFYLPCLQESRNMLHSLWLV